MMAFHYVSGTETFWKIKNKHKCAWSWRHDLVVSLSVRCSSSQGDQGEEESAVLEPVVLWFLRLGGRVAISERIWYAAGFGKKLLGSLSHCWFSRLRKHFWTRGPSRAGSWRLKITYHCLFPLGFLCVQFPLH